MHNSVPEDEDRDDKCGESTNHSPELIFSLKVEGHGHPVDVALLDAIRERVSHSS